LESIETPWLTAWLGVRIQNDIPAYEFRTAQRMIHRFMHENHLWELAGIVEAELISGLECIRERRAAQKSYAEQVYKRESGENIA
jgi:hypothetical protein